MLILLFAFLTFAIIVTLIGVCLSPRKSGSVNRGVSYTRQMDAGRANVRRVHRVGENRRMNVRRSPVEIERRAWIDILASFDVSSLFVHRRKWRETPWLGMILVLLTLFVFGVYFLRTVLPSPALFALMPSDTVPTTTNSTNSGTQMISRASTSLIRLNQLDPKQYSSLPDYNTWAYSACSAAAMAEVINAYGHHYRVGDVLNVEARLGAITPEEGLLAPSGIEKTVGAFGFRTTWLTKPSLDDVIRIGNNGSPVIVAFPPDRYQGGHILVVVGGDSNYVYTADSSLYNRHSFTRSKFMSLWVGFAAVVTPKAQN